jgi:spermidine/putrescine-binding protein
LPGLNAIVPAMRALPGTTVDGRLYAVPLEAGVVGIVYDPRVVTRPPVSFRAFFSPSATGRVAMIDSPVLGLQIGALALGYREPAALDDAPLLRVTGLYEKRRDDFRIFWRRRSGLLRAFRSGGTSRWPPPRRATPCGFVSTGSRCGSSPAPKAGSCGLAWRGSPQAHPPDAAYAFLASALSPAAQAAKAGRYHAASLNGGSLTAPGALPPEVALLTTTAAQRAVTVVRPADYAAWLIAWTKAKQPRRPGGG